MTLVTLLDKQKIILNIGPDFCRSVLKSLAGLLEELCSEISYFDVGADAGI